MQTLRWTGLTVCAVLTAVSLVYGIVYLTEGSAGPGGSNLAWAASFAGSTVLLWRRGGRRLAFKVLAVLLCWWWCSTSCSLSGTRVAIGRSLCRSGFTA
jgi:hypothetical protein